MTLNLSLSKTVGVVESISKKHSMTFIRRKEVLIRNTSAKKQYLIYNFFHKFLIYTILLLSKSKNVP